MSIRLLTSVKDEGPFLLEWIAHHKVVGFDRIMIAYNNCSDGSEQLLYALAELGEIEIFENSVPDGASPQQAAYDQLHQSEFIQTADWLSILDADEFLNVHVGEGLVQDLVIGFDDQDFIALNWVNFGDQGCDLWEDCPVTEMFTYAAIGKHRLNRGVKSITRRPRNFTGLQNHHPGNFADKRLMKYVNGAGQQFDYALERDGPMVHELNTFPVEKVAHELAQINHYAIKTIDSFCLRVERGRGVRVKYRRLRHSNFYFRRRHEESNSLEPSISKYFDTRRTEQSRLLALPSIKTLNDEIKREYIRRLETVRARLDKGELNMEDYAEPSNINLSKGDTNEKCD